MLQHHERFQEGHTLDQIQIDKNGPAPTYTIKIGGLVHIDFHFKLLDDSGTNKLDEKQGVNSAQPQFTFNLDAVPVSDLDGRILSLMAFVASFDGSSTPTYDVSVVVGQAGRSSPMTVTKPALSGGSAMVFASAQFKL
jgi:hypothetical protein